MLRMKNLFLSLLAFSYSLCSIGVEDDSDPSTITGPPPYVDITLVDHGEGGTGDVHKVQCNSSSEHIAFCLVGAPCESEYIYGLPNGSNFSLSDTLKYHGNESGRTLYNRILELSVAAEQDNTLLALQCKAGKGKEAYTKAVLLHVKGLQQCPSPSESTYTYLCCSGLSPLLKWKMMTALVLTAIFAAWCEL